MVQIFPTRASPPAPPLPDPWSRGAASYDTGVVAETGVGIGTSTTVIPAETLEEQLDVNVEVEAEERRKPSMWDNQVIMNTFVAGVCLCSREREADDRWARWSREQDSSQPVRTAEDHSVSGNADRDLHLGLG